MPYAIATCGVCIDRHTFIDYISISLGTKKKHRYIALESGYRGQPVNQDIAQTKHENPPKKKSINSMRIIVHE